MFTRKNYPVCSGQHICMILVSFEGLLNKAINKGYLVKFQSCISYIQQFEILGNFETSYFPIDVNGDVAQKMTTKS